MYSQNTPVHLRLWNSDLWRLAIAHMLITMTTYMQVVMLPRWMNVTSLDRNATAFAMVAFSIGLVAVGGFCNYLVQIYRRNHVCQAALILITVVLALLYYEVHWLSAIPLQWRLPGILFMRFLYGAAFGLSQMTLLSTLVIDVSESSQRTEANYGVAWFGRFGMALGTIAACYIQKVFTFEYVVFASAACSLLSFILIQRVEFPFKAPEENVCKYSLDRFFLTEGWLLFLNLLLVTIVMGIVLSKQLELSFFCTMTVGFFLSLIAEKYVFADADLRSETVVGHILILAALLILHFKPDVSPYVPPLFLGFSIGIIGARFLLFSIMLSHHCQRGTSQSSIFLSWELGISVGLTVGYLSAERYTDVIGMVLIALSLGLYHFVTHSWYLSNKKR